MHVTYLFLENNDKENEEQYIKPWENWVFGFCFFEQVRGVHGIKFMACLN